MDPRTAGGEAAERHAPSVVYRRELVDCGKERCYKCSKATAHGPYWYAYWWQGGKTLSQGG